MVGVTFYNVHNEQTFWFLNEQILFSDRTVTWKIFMYK